MNDLKLAVDIAAGWLVGRIVWFAVQELLIKPLLLWGYRRADTALSDRLPDL